jgi:hypothetical protein
MEQLRQERAGIGAVAIVALGTLLWRASLDRDVFALSYDDFLRVAHATDAGMDRLFPSDLWPPLPFWITSAALSVFPDTRTTPGVVNLVASSLALLATLLLGRSVGLRGWTNAAIVLTLGVLPWWRWLSLSALAEPIAFAPLVLAAVGAVWTADVDETDAGGRRARHGAWLASVALTVGGMARYEVWGAAVVFAALLVPAVRARFGLRPMQRVHALGAAAVPFVFPAAWMSMEFGWTQDPVYFATIARDNATLEPGSVAGPIATARDVLVSVGPLLTVAGWAVWRHRLLSRPRPVPTEAPPAHDGRLRVLAVFTAALLVLHALAQFVALTGAHNTARHYVGLAPLIAVLAARALSTLALRRSLLAGAAAALAPLALAGDPPDAIEPPIAAAAERVRTLRASGVLAPHDRVLVEAHPWDCFALSHAVGVPGLVEWDRNPFAVEVGAVETVAERLENPSLLAQAEDAVRNDLNLRRIGILVTLTPRGASWARHVATDVGGQGTVRVWRVAR